MTWLLPNPKSEHQLSTNEFWPCVLENPRAVQRHRHIIELSAVVLGKHSCDNIKIMSSRCTSMERQYLLPLHLGYYKGCQAKLTDNRTIGSHLGQNTYNNITAMSYSWATTEFQRFLALHISKSKGCMATLTHHQTICRLSRQKCLRQYHYYVLKMSINGASTLFGFACWKIQGLCSNINP